MFLIQAISKFMVACRQAYELDKERVRLEAKVHNLLGEKPQDGGEDEARGQGEGVKKLG